MNLILKYEAIIERLSYRLSRSRFTHTLSVAKTAYTLGRAFLVPDSDCEKLYLAGLFHDITKPLTVSEHIAICQKANTPLTADDLASPPVLHAISGALVARDEFPDIADDVICRAIARHTTGGGDMTLFDKLLYLADYIEPERENAACVASREAFWQDLAESRDPIRTLNDHLLQITEATKRYIQKKNAPLHPKTNETIAFLQKELGQ